MESIVVYVNFQQSAHATYLVKVARLVGHVKCPVSSTRQEAIVTEAGASPGIAVTGEHINLLH